MLQLSNTAMARRVELIIRRLDSLHTLPGVVAQFLSRLSGAQFSPQLPGELVESDPALTVKIFALAHKQRVNFAGKAPSVREILDKLPASMVRNAVLSVKVLQEFDGDNGDDGNRVLLRKQMVQHALGVACCARNIARLVLGEEQEHLAFSAGLLHDVGKLALDEAMPKSLQRIIEEAELQNDCSITIEQRHLGLDHTIIGKRLAEKWHFPNEIALAIWLHHSHPQVICENMPAAKIALTVHLADLIARQSGMGLSGSYDTDEMLSSSAEALSLSNEQLEQITQKLPEQVARRSEIIGLEKRSAGAAYCRLVHDTAAELAENNAELAIANLEFSTRSTHLDFITDFLAGINSDMSAMNIVGGFALRWQKFYQTGPVVVFLVGDSDERLIDAVVADGLGGVNELLMKVPADLPAVPDELRNKFAVLDADESVDWLFEQIEVDFDLTKTKVMPLIAGGEAIGAIVFELRYETEIENHLSKFNLAASMGAEIIALGLSCRGQERLAERFGQLLAQLARAQVQLADAKSLAGIAEMARGAAHELNNPLAVISGRAQLLAETESDENKKQMLNQIQTRTEEVFGIISDLLDFAKPKQPKKTVINVRQLLDKAIQQTCEKHNLKKLEVEIQNIEALKDVFVDNEQITCSIANVLSNALQSYSGDNGPIRIVGGYEKSINSVRLLISDNGCGMDNETVRKATQPFFSAKQAGRKRGMGLAHTKRLVQLNNGTLTITSRPDNGTTVTILLGCAD